MTHVACLITCNADLFIKRLLAHIYPHFDKIIILDGPSVSKSNGNGLKLTGSKASSSDNTLWEIYNFKVNSNPDNKIEVITGKVWNGKTEKFNAALKYIPEGYIWQIDYDEFLMPEDYGKLKDVLKSGTYTDVEFLGRHFWGDPHHHFEMKPGVWGNNPLWRRIFRYRKGDSWLSHEPPRMKRNVPEKLLTWEETNKLGINLFHYGYVHRSQLASKELFYGIPGQILPEWEKWQESKPMNVSGGILSRYDGPHPIDVSFLSQR